MFSETSLRQFETLGQRERPATSQIEVANYISQLSSELQGMAQNSGLRVLAFLLSLAALQAREVVLSMAKVDSEDAHRC